GQGQQEQHDAYRAKDPMHCGAQHIPADSENQRPDESSRRVIEKKARPRHAIGNGEQGGKRAQQSGKPSEEDDRASVTAKQILPEPEPPLVEPDARAVPPQNRKSYEPTDFVADVVADHGADGRSSYDAGNIEFVARA